MKTILVATDFSEYAEHAVSSAASIAKQTGAQLILLHVVNRPLNSDDDSYENYHQMPGYELTITNVKTKLNDTVKKHELKNTKVLHELRYDVFKTILKHADRHKVDLIVMGAYGSMGSEKPFIGSNTERVMLQAQMPVLVVKERFEEFNIQNTVFASEFYGEVYNVFPKMKVILDLFQTNIHLLKVNTPGQFQRTHDSLKLMTAFAKEFGIEDCTKNIYNDITVEDGILNFTESIQADLIAITPDGLWRLAHVFSKNITDKLMKRSVKVILSMKTQQNVSTPTEVF